MDWNFVGWNQDRGPFILVLFESSGLSRETTPEIPNTIGIILSTSKLNQINVQSNQQV